VTATIHHLFTSPGHNFVGHHGKPPGENPIIEHEAVELVAGQGIVGDRFFGWKPDFKGQITFIDLEVVEAVRDHADMPGLPASTFRRNVVIAGADLNALIGREFSLAGTTFTGVEECSPCYWMNDACGCEGVEELMRGRGGLRCRILGDGTLSLGPQELIIEP